MKFFEDFFKTGKTGNQKQEKEHHQFFASKSGQWKSKNNPEVRAHSSISESYQALESPVTIWEEEILVDKLTYQEINESNPVLKSLRNLNTRDLRPHCGWQNDILQGWPANAGKDKKQSLPRASRRNVTYRAIFDFWPPER